MAALYPMSFILGVVLVGIGGVAGYAVKAYGAKTIIADLKIEINRLRNKIGSKGK